MAGNNPLLDTPEDTEDSIGLRAHVAPTEKLELDMNRGLVSAKKTTTELWSSLQTRYVGADQVRTARLATLHGDFERLCMTKAKTLDTFAGRVGGMAARYVALGSTLDAAAMIKKLLDSVSDRLYATVAGVEQFCDVEEMTFEEVLNLLRAFEERLR
ncbi:retrotransposon protein [Hordeum vulgare]|nr:retrotransposon protein [Hordeum vulgare]